MCHSLIVSHLCALLMTLAPPWQHYTMSPVWDGFWRRSTFACTPSTKLSASIRLDLPAPLGPSRPKQIPRRRAKLIPSTATTLSYFFTRSFTSRMGSIIRCQVFRRRRIQVSGSIRVRCQCSSGSPLAPGQLATSRSA